MALPQYLSTTDPEVIATIERNANAYETFIDEVLAWAKERGYDNARTFRFNALSNKPGTTYITGLPGRPDSEAFGEWTVPKSHSSSPKKTNTAERAAMDALRYEPEAVPGLPSTVQFGGSNGEHHYGSPLTFVRDGIAYAAYGEAPKAWGYNGDQELGEQWTEILSSTWSTAHDAWSEE